MSYIVHDMFLEAVLSGADTIRLGDPFDEQATLGPLNNEAVAAKMDRHVSDGGARGAKALRGRRRQPGHPADLCYEFTVADRVSADSLVAADESFSTVAPVITADGDDDLLQRVTR